MTPEEIPLQPWQKERKIVAAKIKRAAEPLKKVLNDLMPYHISTYRLAAILGNILPGIQILERDDDFGFEGTFIMHLFFDEKCKPITVEERVQLQRERYEKKMKDKKEKGDE